MPRSLPALLLVAVLAAGCSPTPMQAQATSTDDGIQATGLVDGKRLSVSDGAPEVVLGDCDPNQGRDTDLCALTTTIDGELLTVVFENPAVLVTGATLTVVPSDCVEAACDAVSDGVVVDVRLGTTLRRAAGGSVQIAAADQRRFVGSFQLELAPGGRLSGGFNLDTLAPTGP